MSDGADPWQGEECLLHQQWLEEQIKRSAGTCDAGKLNAVKDSAKGNHEQKQPNRNEQQPVHSLV